MTPTQPVRFGRSRIRHAEGQDTCLLPAQLVVGEPTEAMRISDTRCRQLLTHARRAELESSEKSRPSLAGHCGPPPGERGFSGSIPNAAGPVRDLGVGVGNLAGLQDKVPPRRGPVTPARTVRRATRIPRRARAFGVTFQAGITVKAASHHFPPPPPTGPPAAGWPSMSTTPTHRIRHRRGGGRLSCGSRMPGACPPCRSISGSRARSIVGNPDTSMSWQGLALSSQRRMTPLRHVGPKVRRAILTPCLS
jgi:hypothetical protein